MLINKLSKTSVDRGVGSSASDALRVLLVWWELPRASSANVIWSASVPHCREVSLDILGVWSPQRSTFTVHAVLPKEPLPPMNKKSRQQLLGAIREVLAEQTGAIIAGVASGIIDWEGSDGKP